MIKFSTYARFHEFLSWSNQQLILSSNFENRIPPWLDSSYLTHDPVTGTVSGNPSFYSPTVESGSLTVGRVYEIMAQSVEDFTADGAAANDVGTIFVASGTSVTLSAVDSVRELSLDATNLITNGGFETAGAGGADVFEGWTEYTEGGTIADETVLVHYGPHSIRLVKGASGSTRATQSVDLVNGASYVISGWYADDGVNSARVYIFNSGGSGIILPVTDLDVVGGSFTKFDIVFTVNVETLGSPFFQLRAADPTGAIAYFDDVSLRRVLPGKELLADPDLDTACGVNWVCDSGVIIGDGVAAWDGTQATTASVYQAGIGELNYIYRLNSYIDACSAGNIRHGIGYDGYTDRLDTTGQRLNYLICAGDLAFRLGGNIDFIGSASYASCSKLILGTTTSTLRLPGARRIKAGLTASDSEWAGVVIAQDSQTSPANFVVAFIDAGDTDDFKAYKVVAGVWTSLIDTNVIYAAGAEVEIRRNGDVFSFYYNGAQVGTNQTVAWMTGAYCGLFATGTESTFSNIECL